MAFAGLKQSFDAVDVDVLVGSLCAAVRAAGDDVLSGSVSPLCRFRDLWTIMVTVQGEIASAMGVVRFTSDADAAEFRMDATDALARLA